MSQAKRKRTRIAAGSREAEIKRRLRRGKVRLLLMDVLLYVAVMTVIVLVLR